MQFFKAAAVATALMSSTVSAVYVLAVNTTASGFPSIQDFDTTDVSYANDSIYIGQISFNLYSEPVIATEQGSLFFISYHQVPTGGQIPYVYLDSYVPVGYTVPHGGYEVPPGANGTDFSFGSDGYLTYGGENKFAACQDDALVSQGGYQIYWAGTAEEPAGFNCSIVDLFQYEY